MSTSSVNSRLQGSFNQPHGIPQLDKDRKIESNQLKINEANGLAGLDPSIEIPMTLLKTDVANGLAGLDALKRIVNSVPFSLLTDMQGQSFVNLLKNGGFESWSAGLTTDPDGWVATRMAANFPARSATARINTYSANVRWDGVTGTNGALYIILPNYLDYADRTITVACWVKGSAASKIWMGISDGVGITSSSKNTGTEWELITVTRTIPTTPTKLWIILNTDDDAGDNLLDGAILVEGSVCPAFDPHPTDQTPIVLTSAPTDAGANGETRWYAVAGAGGARRLYMSNGTDWKYIAIST